MTAPDRTPAGATDNATDGATPGAVDALVAAGRQLVRAGLSPGSSGNVSVLDGDHILISGTGSSLRHLTGADLARVGLDGTHLGGARASKETALHVAFYQRDAGHRAVVHLHSPHAVALACLAPWAAHNAIPPLTPYFVMRVGQTPLLPYRHPGDPALGDDLLAAPWPLRAALLANHGAVVAGASLDEAVDRATELEEACRIALLTTGSARRELAPEQIRDLADRWRSPWTPATLN
ncbi:class II aldolase/adducin family protein [Promicromonospora panici]|uniref:class II aldolase/adducin family protein n=1 Tax=Promicromonospora panici TaxID=2219658 RepID=UPI00101B9F95|nr:class II aldolase/adducin family protein [Promicromonospora panici]